MTKPTHHTIDADAMLPDVERAAYAHRYHAALARYEAAMRVIESARKARVVADEALAEMTRTQQLLAADASARKAAGHG